MKNKYIIIILIIITIISITIDFVLFKGFNNNSDEKKNEQQNIPEYLLDFKDYKNITLKDILSIKEKRYTVAGLLEEEYSDAETIESIYNMLKIVKIGNETKMGCDDNTTIYIINMNNNENYKVEFECNVLIYNNERYEIIK